VAGPIPFLPFLTHNQVLHACNLGSLPAWISLVFLPRWRHTKTITLAIAVAYSLLYVVLAYVLFSEAMFAVDLGSFSTTDGLSRMFSDATSALAGWAHFIVFDLWTSRFFVLDSVQSGVPHLAVVPCIIACMFFGPLGLLMYVAVKKVCAILNARGDPFAAKTYRF
jgi:flagellar biosynthesis protein FlhB